MIYKEFQGKQLSSLGMGCMRLPVRGGNNNDIDEERVAEMFEYAISHGINYFDTAWGYHGGNSELAVGRALSKYPRESFYLASKFPGYSDENFGRAKEIFERQLEKCQVEYFDFYLFHNVSERNIDAYLDDARYGDFSYLLQQKRNGRIRHLGFSAHGNLDTITRFLEAYGEHLEFCQLQINYLDWTLQHGAAKVELLKKYNIPVWVMEPLRGGKLAVLDEKYADRLRALRPDEGIPAWAFRFLQTVPEVKMILSGMSNFDQLKENIATFETDAPLAAEEWDAILGVASDMLGKDMLPCTACRYCVDYCPQGLNIPWMIEIYNGLRFSGRDFVTSMALSTLSEDKKPSACIGCRSCEAVCPQNIAISEMMSDFARRSKGE